MSIKDLEKQHEVLMKEARKLGEKIREEKAAQKAEENLRQSPRDREVFWYVSWSGAIADLNFDRKDPFHKAAFESGNCYFSKEKAEKQALRGKVSRLLHH